MVQSHPINNGFNLKALKLARRRKHLVLLVKTLPFLLFLGIGVWLAVDYLVHLPYERAEKSSSVWGQAKIGGQKAVDAVMAKLNAPELSKGESALPLVEIFIKGKNLDALDENLPESGKVFQKADVRLGKANTKFADSAASVPNSNKTYKAEVRYRGDSINHWAFPQRSWRVQFRKGKTYQGRRSFNLYLPRTPSRVADYIGYEMGQRMGLLTPEAYPVHFRLNRQFDGTRLFLEQVDQQFLSTRSLEAGIIYVGDITTEQIYTPGTRKLLFHNPDAWEVIQPNLDRGVADGDFGEKHALNYLLSVLNRKQSVAAFAKKIREVLDVEETLKYIALLEIVGSSHVDDTHNHKWYLNPQRGVLQPIVWDTAAYMWGNRYRPDHPSNLLFSRLLLVPEFREKKNQIIWESLNGSLSSEELVNFVKTELKKIGPDVRADPLKLSAVHTRISILSNEKWEESAAQLLSDITNRNRDLQNVLGENKLTYSISRLPADTKRLQLSLFPGSASGVKLSRIEIPVEGVKTGSVITLRREETEASVGSKVAAEPLEVQGRVQDGRVVFALEDHLYSRGVQQNMWEKKPAASVYRYTVNLKGDGILSDEAFLSLSNSITGKSYSQAEITKSIKDSGTENNSGTENTRIGRWQPSQFAPREEIHWSGKVDLQSDLIIGAGTDLIIAPGTQIKLDPHVSILIKGGRLLAKGTDKSPIHFFPAAKGKPWGTIAIQKLSGVATNESIISHAKIEGGSEASRLYSYFNSQLAVHGAKLRIVDSLLLGGGLSAVEAQVSLTRVKIEGALPTAIREIKSNIEKNDVTVLSPKLVHSVAMASENAEGTDPRTEREYRFSLTGNSLEGAKIAEDVASALAAAVVDPNRWHTSKLIGNPYRASGDPGEAVYRDIYLDTNDLVNAHHHVSYRLRNRFKNERHHEMHFRYPDISDFWPYRVEFQGKTGRESSGDNLTTVEEARFEFRRQSKPFSIENPPPPPPWALNEFLPFMQSGRFHSILTSPAKLIMQYLSKELPGRSEYEFVPQVVVATTRRRQHLEIKSPWGSGPNPDQAYIITLDESRIFAAKEYLEFGDKARLGKKVNLPAPVGSLMEIEIEFERNVSDKLDKDIVVAKQNGDLETEKSLVAARDAFLADQKVIVAAMADKLKADQVKLAPVFESKYRQALSFLTESDAPS